MTPFSTSCDYQVPGQAGTLRRYICDGSAGNLQTTCLSGSHARH